MPGAKLLPLLGHSFPWHGADYIDFRQKTLKSCWVTDFSGLRSWFLQRTFCPSSLEFTSHSFKECWSLCQPGASAGGSQASSVASLGAERGCAHSIEPLSIAAVRVEGGRGEKPRLSLVLLVALE